MDIRVLDENEKEGTMSLMLKDSTTTFANLLRRYITEKVPTMAIHEIEFKDNSSILYDEVIANRMGLISLTTDLKSYYPMAECKCNGEGCSRCTLKLSLTAKGPGTVYASQVKSKDPKVKPVYGETPIVKLLKDQAIELVATAVLGRGTEHVKFAPGLVYYHHKTDVKINKSIKNAEEFIKNCPAPLFELKNKAVVVNPDHMHQAHLVEEYVKSAEPQDAVEITTTDELIMHLESWGQLSCKEMILEALNQYTQDLEAFENLWK